MSADDIARRTRFRTRRSRTRRRRRARRSGLSADADRDVPAPRAVRRRVRPARRVPPRVPAAMFLQTRPSWVTCRAARSSRSTTTIACSRTS
jgi:hypothetical protein